MAEKKSTATRTRNYASVVYPESAPADWIQRLTDAKVPAFVSPLHDQDVNPGGEIKKAHYHVMLLFEGPKTVDQAREIFDRLCAVGCEVVNSQRGYARYLCHLDNPEKHQYPKEEVRSFCGADYLATIDLPTDRYKVISEMIEWCCNESCTSYRDLLLYAMQHRSDWFRVLCDNGTYVMKEFLKSSEWSNNKKDEGRL